MKGCDPVDQPTKGAVEAMVANAVVRFQREQQGRGPGDVRAHIVGAMVVVRCTDILTATEARLSVTEEGRRLVRSARQELHAISHEEMDAIITGLTHSAVMRSYYDVNVDAAEQVEVFVLKDNLEDAFRKRSRDD
jgi:uncharacterized protein YbcI